MKRKQSRPHKSKNQQFAQRLIESYHGEVQAGATLALSVPSTLPPKRAFHPLSVHLELSAHPRPTTVQIALYGFSGKRIWSTGPRLIATTKTVLRVKWPFGLGVWPDDVVKSATVWALDHLCIHKGSDEFISYTAKLTLVMANEMEDEQCPNLHSAYCDDNFEMVSK